MNYTLNCRGKLLVFENPVVMGILNATPDSFYTKGRQNTIAAHLENAGAMLRQGAAVIDVGGMSTRPSAPFVSVQEESDRVLPAIEAIAKEFPEAIISIDTYRATVAQAAVNAGAAMVNDISAGDMDADMLPTVAALNVPYIATHMQGTPHTMQQNPLYENIGLEVLRYFAEKLRQCTLAGIKDVILDPGFGFGKTIAHNYQLLHHLHVLQMLECPLLAGVSRKSMIYKLLDTDAEHALNGTTAVHVLALQQGAAILRVHDVAEARQCIDICQYHNQVI
ncbi:MAG: dihydropteroate synthase [Edaphocola sp.]